MAKDGPAKTKKSGNPLDPAPSTSESRRSRKNMKKDVSRDPSMTGSVASMKRKKKNKQGSTGLISVDGGGEGDKDKIEETSGDNAAPDLDKEPSSGKKKSLKAGGCLVVVPEENETPAAQDVYEKLLEQVPEECLTVPIIMECLLEQIVINVGVGPPEGEESEDNTNRKSSAQETPPDDSSSPQENQEPSDQKKKSSASDPATLDKTKKRSSDPTRASGGSGSIPLSSPFSKFGKPDWGSVVIHDGLKTLGDCEEKEDGEGPKVKPPPLYIKNGDYASMRACHLNEFVASRIAATQAAGDHLNAQGILWNTAPEFDTGLQAKLLANLNHFMYFLPPDMIQMEDMFFILHLLIAAGVEAQLHKEAEVAHKHVGGEGEIIEEDVMISGTKMAMAHQYLAINEAAGVHLILAADKDKDKTNIKRVKICEDKGKRRKSSKGKSKANILNLAADQVGEIVVKAAKLSTEDNKESVFSFASERRSSSGGLPTTPYIACEPEFFKSLKDTSVFQALLECPALTAISASGALDLKTWIQAYLLSAGMSQTGADGVLIGELKDWNYVEELTPIQTVQLLSEALGNYLSMQRMYCPFYDTLLLIFNNPVPKNMKSDAKIKYAISTAYDLCDPVKLMETPAEGAGTQDLKSGRGSAEQPPSSPLESLSVETLMKIIPEEQWLLVPSIKYMLHQQKEGEDQEACKQQQPVPQPPVIPEVTETKSKGKIKVGKSKSRVNNSGDPTNKKSKNPLKDESSPPVPPPTPATPDLPDVPSFHMMESIRQNIAEEAAAGAGAGDMGNFEIFDLGKKSIPAVSEMHQLFPMDGRIIRYDVTNIEDIDPPIQLSQLTVSKNGHCVYFYPQKKSEASSYSVCPYFHMAHSNGVVFAFQDLRHKDPVPYKKEGTTSKDDDKPQQPSSTRGFPLDKIIFDNAGNPIEIVPEITTADEQGRKSTASTPRKSEPGKEESSQRQSQSSERKSLPKDEEQQPSLETKRQSSVSRERSVQISEMDDRGKGKQKKPKNNGSQMSIVPSETSISQTEEKRNTLVTEETPKRESTPGPAGTLAPPTGGEWAYSDGELTDTEYAITTPKMKKRSFYTFTWDKAASVLEPMTHQLRILLPSGLQVEVVDQPGPPLGRTVRQSYVARGSASVIHRESARYYTMDGTVVKFMQNGTIQTISARGVVANIREIATGAQKVEDDLEEILGTNSIRIHNGDIILPTGKFWQIEEGQRKHHDPLYVYTSSPVASNGEVFRRRQDGVMFLHRYDGTSITHYPDGTRFTSRMINDNSHYSSHDEDLEKWEVVGLKIMIEHPNYSTVIYNSLSSNIHIRLPMGNWIRIFANGTIRATTFDEFSLEVDRTKALLSYPPCGSGSSQKGKDIPNLTAVKLWEGKDTGGRDSKSGEADHQAPQGGSRKSSQYSQSTDANEILELLDLSNPSTLCKAVDSLNNQFTMDISGESKVQSSSTADASVMTTEDLISALSEHCLLPKEFVSGIINKTSSTELATTAQRIAALKSSAKEGCGGTFGFGPTKMFVVKRDLSGYEYMKETFVNAVVRKANSCRDSVVMTDPLPSGVDGHPRKYVTVMEPIEEINKPSGAWTMSYREPAFRPGPAPMMTNKELHRSDPENVRWFAYVLSKAHKHKPKFIASAREAFKEKIAKAEESEGRKSSKKVSQSESEPRSSTATEDKRKSTNNPPEKKRCSESDYPENIPDLKGIYGEDQDCPPQFRLQYHADVCTTKKAVVTRSFIEIPQVDEPMQRALLAASMSYANTIEAQLESLEGKKISDDRTPEQKEKDSKMKKQFVQNNLSDMHLLEQRAGRSLRFYF